MFPTLNNAKNLNINDSDKICGHHYYLVYKLGIHAESGLCILIVFAYIVSVPNIWKF